MDETNRKEGGMRRDAAVVRCVRGMMTTHPSELER
jgi:hypothetical protein